MPTDLTDLKSLIHERSICLRLPICKHSEELYPDSIVKLLSLQSVGAFPIYGKEFDMACEMLMSEWVQNKITDRDEYVRELLRTIKSEGCVEILCARLQAESIKTGNAPTVINTRHGSITVGGEEVDYNIQSRIKSLLTTYNIPILPLDELDAIIAKLNRTTSWDQKVLTWVACIIIKSQLSKASNSGSTQLLRLPSPDYSSIT